MTDRPTISVTLPSSQAQVKLYEYLTYRELRLIRRKLLESTKIDPNNPNKPIEFSAAITQDIEDEALRLLVVSITTNNGDVSDPVEYIQDLRSEDGEFLYNKINEIYKQAEHSPEDKKK